MHNRPRKRTRPIGPQSDRSAAESIARDLGITPNDLRRLVADARNRPDPAPAPVVLVKLGPGGDFTRDIVG